MSEFTARSELLSWGRTPRMPMRVASPSFRDELDILVRDGASGPNGLLSSGMRRSYGDSCINDGGAVVHMTGP
jgi:hypothetical protein